MSVERRESLGIFRCLAYCSYKYHHAILTRVLYILKNVLIVSFGIDPSILFFLWMCSLEV